MLCRRNDRDICEGLLKSALDRKDHAQPFPRLVVEAARHFLGAPYEAGTLEREGPEELIVNLRAFDCVTLVENAVVIAGLIRKRKTAFADYTAALERIRYRRGRREGYASRLHYFTDWLYDNGRKDLLRDITGESGGIPFRKALHALTDRREDHPPMKDAAVFRRMRIVEGLCSRRSLHYIPKSDVTGVSGKIEAGDLIAITTDEQGLDVSHVGIAVPVAGEFHLLHASSAAGQVVLSDVTVRRYLLAKRSRTGIIVGRAIAPDAGPQGRRRRAPMSPSRVDRK